MRAIDLRGRTQTVRLGVYADLLYQSDGNAVSTDQAFVEFVLNLAAHVDELVVFGRLSPTAGRAPYVLPSAGVRFVALPSYPSTADLVGVLRGFRRSVETVAREARTLDAVWLFGPHPLSLAFALVARLRGIRVFLGVRQDFPRYIAGRLPRARHGANIELRAPRSDRRAVRLSTRDQAGSLPRRGVDHGAPRAAGSGCGRTPENDGGPGGAPGRGGDPLLQRRCHLAHHGRFGP